MNLKIGTKGELDTSGLEDIFRKDYSKSHPMMKQQYTYLDLKAAFEAGVELINYDWHMAEFHGIKCECAPLVYNSFEEWFKEANKIEKNNAGRRKNLSISRIF